MESPLREVPRTELCPECGERGSILLCPECGKSIKRFHCIFYAAGTDYTAVSSTITISAGQTTASVSVATAQDAVVELDETFQVNLANPSAGVVIGNGVGTVTITEDDGMSTNKAHIESAVHV